MAAGGVMNRTVTRKSTAVMAAKTDIAGHSAMVSFSCTYRPVCQERKARTGKDSEERMARKVFALG